MISRRNYERHKCFILITIVKKDPIYSEMGGRSDQPEPFSPAGILSRAKRHIFYWLIDTNLSTPNKLASNAAKFGGDKNYNRFIFMKMLNEDRTLPGRQTIRNQSRCSLSDNRALPPSP